MANYYTPFSLRVSEELLDKVKQLAAAHKRSANKEIASSRWSNTWPPTNRSTGASACRRRRSVS